MLYVQSVLMTTDIKNFSLLCSSVLTIIHKPRGGKYETIDRFGTHGIGISNVWP